MPGPEGPPEQDERMWPWLLVALGLLLAVAVAIASGSR